MEREAKTNILMMDACRDNPLARNLARALGTRSMQIGKGFAPIESGEGTLISFSTQPGNVALDGTGGRNSPYTAALLKNIGSGDDLPTILISVRNEVMQNTNRRQVPWEHSALTAKFYFTPPRQNDQQIELTFWMSVKDSKTPAVLGTYLERYPSGEFASIARALIETYDSQNKLEQAAREGERKRQEEAAKATEAKRLEDEHRAREAALAAGQKRAEETKNSQEAARLEAERVELLARNEQLRKALEDARVAREAAKAAEEQRVAAVKAAENARKLADEAIAKKRDAAPAGDPTKLAALPKLEKAAPPAAGLGGSWMIKWTTGPGCRISGSGSYLWPVRPSASGSASWTQLSKYDGAPVRYTGTFRGNTGSGTFVRQDGRCSGYFTATRGG